MNKKILSLLACGALLMGLTACGSDDSASSEEKQSKTEQEAKNEVEKEKQTEQPEQTEAEQTKSTEAERLKKEEEAKKKAEAEVAAQQVKVDKEIETSKESIRNVLNMTDKSIASFKKAGPLTATDLGVLAGDLKLALEHVGDIKSIKGETEAIKNFEAKLNEYIQAFESGQEKDVKELIAGIDSL
ncbi:hypothetical protein [Bacillus manliponensis]|uniref:hypothetical protein n=1 Tax=Bacillus manliponensis TaxID=574376 RepID=UPI0035154583